MGKRKKNSILPPDPDAVKLEADEQPFEELPPVDEGDDDAKVGSEVDERCVFCNEKLTTGEIGADIERCRAAGWPEPAVGERGCGKAACKSERKSLNTSEYGSPQQMGDIHATSHRRADYIHATSHELNDLFDGRPLGGLRPVVVPRPADGKVGSVEPATPEFSSEILAVYEQWFQDGAPSSIKHPRRLFHAVNRRVLLQHAMKNGGEVTPASLSEAVKACTGRLFHIATPRTVVKRESPKLQKPKVGRPKKEKVAEQSQEQESVGFRFLRHELRLKSPVRNSDKITPRQIAKWMRHPEFNKPALSNDVDLLSTEPKYIKELERIRAMKGEHGVETIERHMNILMSSLPLVEKRPIPANQIQFYQDYASGNYTELQLIDRHGGAMLSGLFVLENDIIKQLAYAGVVRIPDAPDYDPENLERDWDLERQAILNGSVVGGTILAGKVNYRTGHYRPLNSFDIAQHTYVKGTGGESEGEGPDYRDESEDPE